MQVIHLSNIHVLYLTIFISKAQINVLIVKLRGNVLKINVLMNSIRNTSNFNNSQITTSINLL